MAEGAVSTLARAPALAGGLLRTWNETLLHLAEARALGARARLVFDDGACREDDRALHLVQAGDPVRLPGPSNGRFAAGERRALVLAASDRLRGRRERERLEAWLHHDDEGPAEAAVRVFRALFAEHGLAVDAGPGGDADRGNTLPELVWIGPRLDQVLAGLDVPLEEALRGEPALRAAWRPPALEPLLEEVDRLEADLATRLGALEERVGEHAAHLFGAWTRLRRGLLRSLREFRTRAARDRKHRGAVQGARIHAAAQLLRPQGRSQQDGLGLLVAAGALELPIEEPGAILATLEAARPADGWPPETWVIDSASGAIRLRVPRDET